MILRLTTRERRLLRTVTAAMLSPNHYTSEQHWHFGILGPLTQLVGSQKGGVRLSTTAGHLWTEFAFDHAAIQAYSEYFERFDHGRALTGPEVSSRVNSTIHRFQNRLPELFRSEFYCDFLKPFGFLDSLALSTRRTKQEKGTTLYVWHERELDGFDRARRMALLRLLAPAFRSGMHASAQVSSTRGSFYALLDQMSEGCALFSATGVLLHQNTALIALLARSSAPLALADSIANAAKNVRETCLPRSRTEANPFALSVDDQRAEGSYRVSGSMFKDSPANGEGAILVTVTFTSSTHRRVPIPLLQERYGLTKRESQVALHLIARQTNREIAHHLGMSLHTARHHTENIMRKLGVGSRAEIATVLG